MSETNDYDSDTSFSEHSQEHQINEENRNEVDFEVLHPENPLMIRFQNALKNLLAQKLEKIQEENRKTESETKSFINNVKKLSDKLFDQKSEVDKQRIKLDQHSEYISNLIATRQQIENELNLLKDQYTKELNSLKSNEKLNQELRTKVESQSHLLFQLRQYEKNQAASLSVIHGVLSKNKTEIEHKLKEREKQDYLLMILENEVFKLEMMLEGCKREVNNVCSELALLKENLIEKENEFQIASEDNSDLLKFWKNLIFMISKHDKKFYDLKAELEKKEIELKSKQIEFHNYQRSVKEEMMKNEILMGEKNRVDSTLTEVEKHFDELLQQKLKKEEENNNLISMIECTETNLKNTVEEEVELQRELCLLQNKITKLNLEKYELEEFFLVKLQNEIVSSGEASKLYAEIQKLREQIKMKEADQSELEQKYRNELHNLQHKNNDLDHHKMCANDKTAEIKNLEKELHYTEEKLEQTKIQIKLQNNTLDKKRKELETLKDKPSLCVDLVEKIQQTEENIKEVSKQLERAKKEWIRKQNEIMLLTKKKSQTMIELNNMQKNYTLLQNALRHVEENIFTANKESKNLDKSTSFLLLKITKLNALYSEERIKGEKLNSENYFTQNNVLEKLKEAENETLQTFEEIEKIEKSKKDLEEQFLAIQREDLEWEKKVKLANEMKNYILKEESENGDIGAMKTEIHRMEIRHAQLKKAQESLVTDLESSVLKRDSIFDNMLVKEKSKNNAVRARQALDRKIRNIEATIEKLKKELSKQEADYSILCDEKNGFYDEIKQIKMEIETNEIANKDLDEKIQESVLRKHKNLEILIRKQKLADFLSLLHAGKIKGLNQCEEVIEKNYLKHRYLNSDLINVLEDVCNDFPQLKNEIIPILNIAQARSV